MAFCALCGGDDHEEQQLLIALQHSAMQCGRQIQADMAFASSCAVCSGDGSR